MSLLTLSPRTKIKKAVAQIRRNYERLKNRETVNLHNLDYDVALEYEGLNEFVGLIVLLCDEPLSFCPTEVVPDLYEHEIPVYVFSWDDLKRMVQEVDTVPDLAYYLGDRLDFLKRGTDIPVGRELHALGAYKMGNNSFGRDLPDFARTDVWQQYQSEMAAEISARDRHNKYAELFDHIAGLLPTFRALHDGLPAGLYFAWELGSITRRMRACYGERLKSVEDCFAQGKMARKFALFNKVTGNWTVFFFSKQEPADLVRRLVRLVNLKLVKEVHQKGFSQGVYGLGFKVSRLVPPQFALVAATVNGADSVRGYTSADLAEAYREFGSQPYTHVWKIEEFPHDS